MWIALSTKTEHKQALKLYNQICTYLFEQEYGDLRYNEKLKKTITGDCERT